MIAANRIWTIEDAEDRLGDVIDAALNEGPQIISRLGAEVAVVVSHEDYRKLRLRQMPLVEFFRSSPLVGVQLDLTRDAPSASDVTESSDYC